MHHLVIIVGNLGRDPEMRYTPAGKAVCNFSVGTNRKYTNAAGELVKETVWFRISTWGRTAEVCNEYLVKGRSVYIEGRLVPDPKTGSPKVYEGKNGPGASYDVSASTVRFLGGNGEHHEASGDDEYAGGGEENENIPF